MTGIVQGLMASLLFLLISTSLPGQNDVILVDFGSPNEMSPMPWNNITNASTGVIADLANDMGFLTGKGLRITDRFNAPGPYGTTTPDPQLGYPATATQDYFFGNVASFGNHILPTAGFELFHLDTAVAYTVEIFASRNHTNNLQTQYILRGSSTDTLYLDAASNTSQVVTATLKPDSTGVIAVVMTVGPDNNSANGFYYINAMKVSYPHIPSSEPPALVLKAPAGGEFWQVGKTPKVIWHSTQISHVVLEYSTDLGSTWTFIDSLWHYESPYAWTVPNTPSTQCLVRVRHDTLVSVSPQPFQISTDTTTCTIVVLGSSTAAGAGATPSDSAWVNRYRFAMQQQNTAFEVINLARGGYTTYHILPSGTQQPPHVQVEIDTLRNITEALRHNPYGIIINMPSNDAAYGFPAGEQMVNFRLLYQTAVVEGVKTWVCTPQPRNFAQQNRIQTQYDLLDSITTTFPDVAIDFWNGLTDAQGYILPQYDAGDGVHLNNQGHLLLFQRVMEARTDTPGCVPYIYIEPNKPPAASGALVYPNPFRKELNINLKNKEYKHLYLTLTDLMGRVLDEISLDTIPSQGEPVSWSPTLPEKLAPQLLIITINTKNLRGETTRDTVKVMYSGR